MWRPASITVAAIAIALVGAVSPTNREAPSEQPKLVDRNDAGTSPPSGAGSDEGLSGRAGNRCWSHDPDVPRCEWTGLSRCLPRARALANGPIRVAVWLAVRIVTGGGLLLRRSEWLSGSETVWRAALMARGKDWVMAELRRRPGGPGDAVYDVLRSPLPTREFCQRWCAERGKPAWFAFPGRRWRHCFPGLTIVCAVGAVKSCEMTRRRRAARTATNSAPQASPARGSNQITNDVPGSTSQRAAEFSAVGNSPPPLCGTSL